MVIVAAPPVLKSLTWMPCRFIGADCVPMVEPLLTVTIVVEAPPSCMWNLMPLLLSLPVFGVLARCRMFTLPVALPTVSARVPPVAVLLTKAMADPALLLADPEVTVHAVAAPGTLTVPAALE